MWRLNSSCFRKRASWTGRSSCEQIGERCEVIGGSGDQHCDVKVPSAKGRQPPQKRRRERDAAAVTEHDAEDLPQVVLADTRSGCRTRVCPLA